MTKAAAAAAAKHVLTDNVSSMEVRTIGDGRLIVCCHDDSLLTEILPCRFSEMQLCLSFVHFPAWSGLHFMGRSG